MAKGARERVVHSLRSLIFSQSGQPLPSRGCPISVVYRTRTWFGARCTRLIRREKDGGVIYSFFNIDANVSERARKKMKVRIHCAKVKGRADAGVT